MDSVWGGACRAWHGVYGSSAAGGGSWGAWDYGMHPGACFGAEAWARTGIKQNIHQFS